MALGRGVRLALEPPRPDRVRGPVAARGLRLGGAQPGGRRDRAADRPALDPPLPRRERPARRRREDPEADARLASRLLERHGLDFYVANAEREYAYTNDGVWDAARYERSARFVAAFRRAKPALPAALSSYCRPDTQDVNWHAWRDGGFAFLPQAYVNDFGDDAAPALCVASAEAYFPRGRVHPTIGSGEGRAGTVDPARYAELLARAATTGFSIYPAESGARPSEYADVLPRVATPPSPPGRAGDGLELHEDPVG